jgi:hypothetical protein
MRKIIPKLILYIFIIAFAISFVSAVPVPLGIDGTVYATDGMTRAGSSVKFSVFDSDSGFYIEDNLRTDGRYSVVISGNPGETITVRAWTQNNNVSQTISLNGVMHNFNMILNLSMPRLPPQIISVPVLVAYEDIEYAYDVEATSPNNAIFAYQLLDAPPSMQIDAVSGLISWIPQENDVGMHNVSVKVPDGDLFDTQTFVLEVLSVNDPPVFTSIPGTDAKAGEKYNYDADAVDPDSSNLTYSLIISPPGMAVDTSSGLISWTPGVLQAGSHNIIIEVSDGNLSALQSYILFVNNFTNHDPSITSVPVTVSYEDSIYTYNVTANDIDGDNLTFLIIEAPAGMNIGTRNGNISYLPDNNEVGQHNITIKAQDLHGGFTVQRFLLKIINVNDPPILVSTPRITVYQWDLYSYDADALDPDGDNLTYSLIKKQPLMSINKKTGMIYWLPTKIGTYEIIVQVKDSNLSTKQIFSVEVMPRNKVNLFAIDVKQKNKFYDASITKTDMIISGIKTKTARAENDYLIVSERKEDSLNSSSMIALDSLNYITVASKNSFDDNMNYEKSKITLKIKDDVNADRVVFYYFNVSIGGYHEIKSEFSGYKGNYNYFDIETLLPVSLIQGVRKTANDLRNNLIFSSKEIQSIRKPFVIMGKVFFSDDSPAKDGIRYEIINLRTNESVYGTIRKELNAYTEVVSGRIGDEVIMKLGRGDDFEEKKLKITGDVTREDVTLKMTTVEYEYAEMKERILFLFPSAVLIIIMLLPLAIIFFNIGRRKKK